MNLNEFVRLHDYLSQLLTFNKSGIELVNNFEHKKRHFRLKTASNRNNTQTLVAGVGFEPTTFKL